MFKKKTHIVRSALAVMITAAAMFSVFFGQGTHLHDIAFHFDKHLDLHVHVHAHESHDSPFSSQSDQNGHQHEVNSSSDIIATLTSSYQLNPDFRTITVISSALSSVSVNDTPEECPTLYDLPPPESSDARYYLSSFSHRGPPVA